MSEPKPVYTITPDIDMGQTCPSCGVGIAIGNAGGYRTYCEGCCISGDGYTLLVDDCLNVMGNMADGTIDLTVTSPPYDNLRSYGKDFDADSFDWYPIIKELYRVTAVGGVVVWVVADATINGSETGTSFKQALWAMGYGIATDDAQAHEAVMKILESELSNEDKTDLIHKYYLMRQNHAMFNECGFRLHDTMIYQTDKPPMNDNRYQACFEYMFVFSKGKPKTFNPVKIESTQAGKKRTGINYYNADGTKKDQWRGGKYFATKVKNAVWYFASGNNGDDEIAGNHSARFPEDLANDHIRSWSNPGDLVFDPFLGSGTTGKMAIRNGRKFIGCDIESSYVDIARQRIETEIVRLANAAGDYVTTDKEKATGQMAIWDAS